MPTLHDYALRSTYGRGDARCVCCDEPQTDRAPLQHATAEQARAAFRVVEGDLVCARCAEDLDADAAELAIEADDLAARCRATVAAHPVTVALCLRLPRIAAALACGALLLPCDRAMLDERADAARDAWVAALEAETDLPDPPPWSLAWEPEGVEVAA